MRLLPICLTVLLLFSQVSRAALDCPALLADTTSFASIQLREDALALGFQRIPGTDFFKAEEVLLRIGTEGEFQIFKDVFKLNPGLREEIGSIDVDERDTFAKGKDSQGDYVLSLKSLAYHSWPPPWETRKPFHELKSRSIPEKYNVQNIFSGIWNRLSRRNSPRLDPDRFSKRLVDAGFRDFNGHVFFRKGRLDNFVVLLNLDDLGRPEEIFVEKTSEFPSLTANNGRISFAPTRIESFLPSTGQLVLSSRFERMALDVGRLSTLSTGQNPGVPPQKWGQISPYREDTGFVVGGVNSSRLIRGLRKINNVTIDRLEERMYPQATAGSGSMSSGHGFLLKGQKLLEEMIADNDFVLGKIGRTHQKLAAPLLRALHEALQHYKSGFNGPFEVEIEGWNYTISYEAYLGTQVSPFTLPTSGETPDTTAIDEVYNTKRLHSSLGYKTPSEFETEVLKLKPADRPVQKLWGWTV